MPAMRAYFLIPAGIAIVAAVYWFASYETIGSVMLLIFAIAMAVMGWILMPTLNDVSATPHRSIPTSRIRPLPLIGGLPPQRATLEQCVHDVRRGDALALPSDTAGRRTTRSRHRTVPPR